MVFIYISLMTIMLASIFWPPDVKKWFIWKDPDAGKDWGQEEKGTTDDEMVGWYHWLNGHEFEQTAGDGKGQGSLACCSSWSPKESDMTERLNNYSTACWQFLFVLWENVYPSPLPIKIFFVSFLWFSMRVFGVGTSRSPHFIYLFDCVLCHVGLLVPWPGMEPATSAVEAWNLNYWTAREIPRVFSHSMGLSNVSVDTFFIVSFDA